MNTVYLSVGTAMLGIIICLILHGITSFKDYVNNTWKVKLFNVLAKSLCVLLVIELIILIFEIIDFFVTR